MNVETTITTSPNLSGALNALKMPVMLRAVARGMERGTKLIARLGVERDRLTGKGPFPVSQQRLGVVSGHLRQSVRVADPQISGDAVTTSIGSKVSYAAAHEFGFKGEVNVKAHPVTMTKLFGRILKEPLRFTRLAARRKVNIPERRPFRAGIEANIGLLEREVAREVVNEVRTGGRA